MRPNSFSAAPAGRPVGGSGRRLPGARIALALATVFTGGGAFLAAFGAGVHDGLDEAMGAALLGAASLAFLIGFRQILEPKVPAPAASRAPGAPGARL